MNNAFYLFIYLYLKIACVSSALCEHRWLEQCNMWIVLVGKRNM